MKNKTNLTANTYYYGDSIKEAFMRGPVNLGSYEKALEYSKTYKVVMCADRNVTYSLEDELRSVEEYCRDENIKFTDEHKEKYRKLREKYGPLDVECIKEIKRGNLDELLD